jgi:predicted PurR-regulated permease PerM
VARIVSFVVIVVILLVIAGVFIRVMADFVLPLFLAVLLVIIFGPLHRWIRAKCRGHDRIAAALSTLAILLIFIVPLLLVTMLATFEAVKLYGTLKETEIDIRKMAQWVADTGERFGLTLASEDIQKTVTGKLQAWLGPVALGTTQVLLRLLVGLFVMVFAVYYFLADGPGMVKTIMRLSPLDDKYELQLMAQFDSVVRTMVVATLASAVGQGVLAGLGFYFAGLGSVFLLTAVAVLMAMVPFVGAAAVWVPACLWLLYQQHTAAAIGLAIYSAVVVSNIDNVIRPLVLHGGINLHPLLALLSVLGGVQAMGPIGIFVGPMAVAFLQTLLNIFNAELEGISEGLRASRGGATATAPPAAG